MTVMYRFPWELAVANEKFMLDKKQALTDPSMADAVRAQVLSNGRWRQVFTLPTNNYADTAKARNTQLAVNGYANRMKVPADFARVVPRGSAAASMAELVSNGLFQNGTTGWAFTGQAASTRANSLQRLKLVVNAGGVAALADQAITVVANTNYVARCYFEAGTLTVGAALQIGTTANAADIAGSGLILTDGYIELPFNSGAHTTLHINVKIPTTASTNQYGVFNFISAHRCLQVSGANQTGSLLAVKVGPVSTQGLLLSGDIIEILSHTYEVAQDVDTDGSGLATIQIFPPLKNTAIPDAQAIITNYPCNVCLMKSPILYDVVPGPFGSFNFEAIEDLNS